MHIPQLSPAELQRWRQDGKAFLLLDVRTDEETTVCTLPDGLPIVVYCHHGIRSLHTAMYLADAGFETLYNLQGGIDAWAAQIDENMARY